MEAKIVNTKHDKIIVKTKASIANEVALILKNAMKEAGSVFLEIVQVEAQVVKVG